MEVLEIPDIPEEAGNTDQVGITAREGITIGSQKEITITTVGTQVEITIQEDSINILLVRPINVVAATMNPVVRFFF